MNEGSAAWGAPMATVHCAHCQSAHLVSADAIPDRCPFCLQGPIESQPGPARPEPPEQILPYEITEQRLVGFLGRWAEGTLFRPADLEAGLLARRARRYLVPLWLVDARMQASWRADVGFDYQVVSSQDRYVEGIGWSTQDVREDRVRWEPRAGRLDRAYENIPAPALDDHRALMARLGDYDLNRRSAYSPEAVTGAAVRVPSLEPEAAWPGAEATLTRTAQAECQQAAGADHIRDLTLEAQYGDRNWTLLLLPAYVTWYEEGGQTWPVLINGQNGRVSGVRRASTRKANAASLALGAAALLLFVLGGLLALAGLIVPPLVAAGAFILAIGMIVAVVAPGPAISAWVFNRRSQPV